MRFYRWIKGAIWRYDPTQDAATARALAERIAEESDFIQRHLSQYHNYENPFAALMSDFRGHSSGRGQ